MRLWLSAFGAALVDAHHSHAGLRCIRRPRHNCRRLARKVLRNESIAVRRRLAGGGLNAMSQSFSRPSPRTPQNATEPGDGRAMKDWADGPDFVTG
jgi:hypothetical protein